MSFQAGAVSLVLAIFATYVHSVHPYKDAGFAGGAEDVGGLGSTPLLLQRSPRSAPPPLRAPPPPPPAQPQVVNKSGKETPQGSSPQAHRSDQCSGPEAGPSEPTMTCQANCPRCPMCPAPQPTCPSPCAACPSPQQCPLPCATCPTCPSCKQRIPPGYEHFPNLGYYKLHNVPSDWFQAKATCEREGAHLAIINSQAEADLMKMLFQRHPNVGNWIFLGFHDLYKEGTYVTILGQPVSATGYTTWNPGQPDNHNSKEHCGSMYPSGGLNDLVCESKQPFVCEYPE